MIEVLQQSPVWLEGLAQEAVLLPYLRQEGV